MTWNKSLILVVIAIGMTAAIAGTSAAAPSQAANPCEDTEGQKIYAASPAGELIEETSVCLHTGSEIMIVYCNNKDIQPPAESWNLESGVDGYRVQDRQGQGITIIFQSQHDVRITEHLVDMSPDNELTLSPAEAYSSDGPVIDANIRLTSSDEVDSMESVENDFSEAKLEVQSDVDELGELLEQDSLDTDDISEISGLLENMNQQYTTFQESSEELKLLLYERAMMNTQTEQTVVAMEQVMSEQSSVEEDVSAVTSNSMEQLSALRNDAQSTVRMNLLIGLLGGLTVGILIGGVLPWRKGKEVADFYQVSSQNEYSWNVVTLPSLVGVLLVVGGILLMIWAGILGVIV